MSLLLNALEKAAQDREKTPASPQSAASGLALEAVELKPVKPAEDTSRVPLPVGRNRATAAPSSVPAPAAKSSALSGAQAHAATVLSAQPSNAGGAAVWLRAHAVYVMGGLAVVCLLLYGGYVYVQIAHPGLLQKSPPRPPVVVAAPAATAPEAATAGALPPPVPGLSTAGAQATDASLTPTGARSAAPGQPGAAPAVTGVAAATKEISGSVPPQRSQPAPTATQAAAPTAPADPTQARIAISRGDSEVAHISGMVSTAYAALDIGAFDTAQRVYELVIRSEPANVDALLGLASIAQHQNRAEDAQRYFMTILAVEPRNAQAQSALLALISRADPQAAETRLKQLLAREPTPSLYFNLGNVYADQALWAQAQQSYFQAHHLQPRNPDYAYNLAVSLEHLGQHKLALEYYRKAVLLLSARGRANFDEVRAQARITQLAARFK